jgi:hypothetical protein
LDVLFDVRHHQAEFAQIDDARFLAHGSRRDVVLENELASGGINHLRDLRRGERRGRTGFRGRLTIGRRPSVCAALRRAHQSNLGELTQTRSVAVPLAVT